MATKRIAEQASSFAAQMHDRNVCHGKLIYCINTFISITSVHFQHTNKRLADLYHEFDYKLPSYQQDCG